MKLLLEGEVGYEQVKAESEVTALRLIHLGLEICVGATNCRNKLSIATFLQRINKNEILQLLERLPLHLTLPTLFDSTLPLSS
jgi:hypothetical protein